MTKEDAAVKNKTVLVVWRVKWKMSGQDREKLFGSEQLANDFIRRMDTYRAFLEYNESLRATVERIEAVCEDK
jgi:hypothetical protein